MIIDTDTKHKLKVNEAFKSFMGTVIGEIAELLKSIGTEPNQWVSFENPLVLLREENGGYVPCIFEEVTYVEGSHPFIILKDTDDNPLMSGNMTSDEIIKVFNKVFAIVANY